MSNERTEIRFSGAGGQGLQLSAKILASALAGSGKSVAQSQSYEPTSRGGLSRSDLVVSESATGYPLATDLNYLLILDDAALNASQGVMNDGSVVMTDSRRVSSAPAGKANVQSMPFSEIALELGNERVANIVALGALIGKSGLCSRETMEQTITTMVPAKFCQLNLTAFARGLELAESSK
jgi:2-oxoglutarate ferredoxin oxidoreductase subunit gamma